MIDVTLNGANALGLDLTIDVFKEVERPVHELRRGGGWKLDFERRFATVCLLTPNEPELSGGAREARTVRCSE